MLNEDELKALRNDDYSKISVGQSLRQTLSFAIKNISTGIKTDTVKINFILTKSDNFTPDKFPVFEYKLKLDDSVEILKYTGTKSVTNLIIPSKLNGHSVTSIGERAFSESRELQSVIIPDGVIEIGTLAFELCTSLKSVYIPDSVEKIKRAAFYYCSSLTDVHMPSYLTEIPDYMFYMCTSLSEINAPSTLKEIGAHAFNNCKLRSFDFKHGLERVGDYSFEGCMLTSVILPSTCKYIGNWAFYNCKNLNSFIMNREIETLGTEIVYNCPLKAINYLGSEDDWNNVSKKRSIGSKCDVIFTQ